MSKQEKSSLTGVATPLTFCGEQVVQWDNPQKMIDNAL